MRRTTFFLYSLLVYFVFGATALYLVLFLSNVLLLSTIDVGETFPLGQAIGVDVLLLVLFGFQHSVMARESFKQKWTKIVPQPVERSTYVLASSLALGLLCWLWKPISTIVWNVDDPLARGLLVSLAGVGVLILGYSSFLIDHFDLMGLRQTYLYWRGKTYTSPRFVERLFYRYVRHPLMTGVLLALWATPQMSAGRLLFTVGLTLYVFVGIGLEERDHARTFGDEYLAYRQRTAKLIPWLW